MFSLQMDYALRICDHWSLIYLDKDTIIVELHKYFWLFLKFPELI